MKRVSSFFPVFRSKAANSIDTNLKRKQLFKTKALRIFGVSLIGIMFISWIPDHSFAGNLTTGISGQNNVSCNGGSNGSATVTASGGTLPYTYLWGNAQTTQTIFGLSAGTYTVTVTDADLYTATTSAVITQIADGPQTTATSVSACYSGTTGQQISVSVKISNSAFINVGAISLTLLFDNTVLTFINGTSAVIPDNWGLIIANPADGMIRVAAYDPYNNSSLAPLTLEDGTTLFTLNFTYSGGPSGGSSALAWDDSDGSSCEYAMDSPPDYPVFCDIPTGDYYKNGIVTIYPLLSAAISGRINVSCNGGANGSATVTASGGTSPYTYSWSNSQTTQTATGLSAGTYTVTVTDADLCIATTDALITQIADGPQTTATSFSSCNTGTAQQISIPVKVSSFINVGAISLTLLFDNTVLTFINGTSSVIPANWGLIIANPADGMIRVAAYDPYNNSSLSPLTLEDGTTLFTLNFTYTGGPSGGSSALAWDDSDGSSCEYAMDSPPDYPVFCDIPTGDYYKNGIVTVYPLLSAGISAQTNVSHYGFNDGSVTVSASGGTTAYTYLWNNGQTASVASGLTAGTYTVTVTDAHSCNTTATAVITQPVNTDPDINATFINIPIPGNVHTNDDVPAGTTYGTPALSSSPGGSTHVITMNPDGSYVFTGSQPGIYVYEVPVCAPGLPPPPCRNETLTITVIAPYLYPPVAQTDITTTLQGVPVTLNTLANDVAGNVGGIIDPSSVTIVSATAPNPLTEGNLSVDLSTGKITFAPVPAFTGVVTYSYQVCDNTLPTALCATAVQQVTVLPTGSPNTTEAVDDYNVTPQAVNLIVSADAGVLANDNDPDGNHQMVITTAPITVPKKGTVTIAPDGSYVFVPIPVFRGGVGFPYTIRDNGTPPAFASATLYFIVTSFNTDPDINATFVNVPVSGDVHNNDDVIVNTTYGTSPALISSPGGSSPVITMSSDGTYVFTGNKPGVYVYDVPVCAPASLTPPCVNETLTITVTAPLTDTNPPVANLDIAFSLGQPVTLKTLDNDAAGNIGGALVPSSVTIVPSTMPDPVTGGSVSVDPLTGDITFTPVSAFAGTLTYSYSVCDNSLPTPLYATAFQQITVLLSGTTEAADDFIETPQGVTLTVPAVKGVLANDTDPENDLQTVTSTSPETVPGKGTVTIAADGSYVFEPDPCYNGPVSFPYTIVDNGTPVSYASATLYILLTPFIATISPVDVSCNGSATGSATVTVAGGQPDYTYLWNNALTTPTITGLTAGTYTVTVTEQNGCTTTTQATITEPSAWTFSITPNGPTSFCQGGSVTLDAGLYSSYVWSTTEITETILVNAIGTYTVTVTDSHGCTGTDDQAIIVNPLPTVAAITGPASVCVGLTIALSDLTTGGVWSSSDMTKATVNVSGVVMGVADGLATIKYTVRPDGNGCSNSVTHDVTVTPSNNAISGTLLYNNAAHSPMDSVTLKLYKSEGSSWIYQGTWLTAKGSSSTGYYEFSGLCNGDYKIEVMTNNHPDNSINSTDAAQVNWYSVHPADYGLSIEHVRYLAGDVYGNGLEDPNYYINSTDAQHIQQRFIYGPGCGCFDRDTWSYWQAGDVVVPHGSIIHSDDILVTVNGSSLTVNLYAEVTGDFNMSYVPSTTGSKDVSSHLQLIYTGTQKAGASSTFELPIHVVPATNVGAVSMILNFPSDLVEIRDVSMNYGSGNLDWAVNGNELRIGWNSLSPLSLTTGDNLVILSLKTADAFSQGNSIRFELAPSVLNELADGNYNVIPDGLLSMDAVEYSPVGINEPPAESSLTLQSYPNPFSDYTNIVYNLPEDGKVTLEIRNLLGQVVKTLVDEPQVKGLHRLRMEAGSMPRGVYTATVRLKNDDENLTHTIKLMVNW